MRIVFVTNNYKPYSGGVVSSIDATMQELLLQGHDVVLVTLDFLGDVHQDPVHVVRIACPIRFMYKQNHMAVPIQPTQQLLKLVKKYAPDIIHVHHPFLLGVSGLEVARILDIPCVFTYHTMYEQYAHYVPMPHALSTSIIRLVVARFCSSVDGIIVPSSSIKNYVRNHGVIAPVEVIPSSLRTHFLLSHNHQTQEKEKQYFELLLVSRFTKEKNIPFVFDVFKRLSIDVRLTLVGYGTEYENIKQLALEVFKLPHERVRFIHKPEQHDLLGLYRCADLFLFPSKTDTQGLVMAEAMSQGLPVIALDGPGQRDIICNGENGFIVADAEQAAIMIQNIMNNGDMHQKLRRGALATAQNYLPSVQVQQLLDFYEYVTRA